MGSGGGVVGSCVRKRVRVKATLGGGGGSIPHLSPPTAVVFPFSQAKQSYESNDPVISP